MTVGSASGSSGDTITIPVTFVGNGAVAGFEARVEYDASKLSVSVTSVTAVTKSGFSVGTILSSNVATLGEVRLLVANFSGGNIDNGVISIEFTVDAGAALGGTNLILSNIAITDTNTPSAVIPVDTKTDGVVTITGPEVSITATDANAAEAGLATGTFTVTRTGSTAAALTVSLTASGTATAGADYTALPVTVTIPAGADSATLTVTPIDDTTDEGSETVIATISANSSYTIGTAAATVTIADDDKVEVSIVSTTQAKEGITPVLGVFTITRTGPLGAALTVTLNVGGTAVAGTDYDAILSTITIPAGAATATITVTPLDNHDIDGSRSITIALANGTGYVVVSGGGSDAVMVLLDDEAPVIASSTAIPTLSQWALILLSLMLLLVATRFNRTRQ